MSVRVESSPVLFEAATRDALQEVVEALRAVQHGQEVVMSLASRLDGVEARIVGLERSTAERDAQIADMALALQALDANLRLVAEAVGGLERELTPGTAIGRFVRRMMRGGDDGSERSE